METMFAPARRANELEIQRDVEILDRAGLVNQLAHVIPLIIMILNKERQVVYCNQQLSEVLDISSGRDILGLRPGEIFDCIHSHNGCTGCGTSAFCKECGAVNAILDSQTKLGKNERECLITTTNGSALELRVWASSCRYEDTDFTLFTITDIHHEKRRQALEQSFFHDLTNVLTAISGNSRLLQLTDDQEEAGEYVAAIRTACKELTAEIDSHRKLIQAENGVLQIELKENVSSESLIEELIHLFPNQTIVIDPSSENVLMTTDRTLLFRTLLNMVKNAIEAGADSKQVVTIRCLREHDTAIFSVHNADYIPQPAQLHIFQRSFSTKGKGHGLGTYSMRLFGEKYLKGKVGFTTSKPNGTTFYIALPLNHPEH